MDSARRPLKEDPRSAPNALTLPSALPALPAVTRKLQPCRPLPSPVSFLPGPVTFPLP